MLERNIKLIIEYKGTNYYGFQKQPNFVTIQGELEKALKQLFQQEIKVTGAGRTDAGVHAKGQVVNFRISHPRSLEEIQRALNALLPDDIKVREVACVPLSFHERLNAKSRVYQYAILNRKFPSAFLKEFTAFFPYNLMIDKMRAGAEYLLGTYDFRAFSACQRTDPPKSFVRTISRIEIARLGDLVILEIEANSFLYKMVRIITGTLLRVGRGKMPPEYVKEILLSCRRELAGPTLPPNGLCLLAVKY